MSERIALCPLTPPRLARRRSGHPTRFGKSPATLLRELSLPWATLSLSKGSRMVEMPGIEPGSRRVDRIFYMCSCFVFWQRTLVNSKIARCYSDNLSEMALRKRLNPTLNWLTPLTRYWVSRKRCLPKPLGNGRSKWRNAEGVSQDVLHFWY